MPFWPIYPPKKNKIADTINLQDFLCSSLRFRKKDKPSPKIMFLRSSGLEVSQP